LVTLINKRFESFDSYEHEAFIFINKLAQLKLNPKLIVLSVISMEHKSFRK
jgi:hypothetical protein